MSKKLILTIVLLFSWSCELPDAQKSMRADVHPFHDKIAGVLQSGWDIGQSEKVIQVVRREPVLLYASIALPISAETRKEVIELSKESVKYQITVEIGEQVSEEKFHELQSVNDQTEWELRLMENRMSDFAGKGEFFPETPKDIALYGEYQQALQNLPYHRLPDLYDSQNSYYVTTTRPSATVFYHSREEHESKAVLENIYSFAEAYWSKIKPFQYSDDIRVHNAFTNNRDYDKYLHKKNRNLPTQQ
jgi:hypothetical protein